MKRSLNTTDITDITDTTDTTDITDTTVTTETTDTTYSKASRPRTAHNVLFFGLSANPITQQHMRMIKDALTDADMLIIELVFSHIDNSKFMLDYGKRKALLEIALSDLSPEERGKIIVSNYEERSFLKQQSLGQKSGSNDVLELIKSDFPDWDITVVLGGDTWFNLHSRRNWKDWAKLFANYKFLVYRREGIENTVPDPNEVTVEFKEFEGANDESSSRVRCAAGIVYQRNLEDRVIAKSKGESVPELDGLEFLALFTDLDPKVCEGIFSRGDYKPNV